ncbi:MAG: histidine--tRNA ligase [Odoribacter sp.]|nr:histidine--tRNA ligase [Odoribacter sp.]
MAQKPSIPKGTRDFGPAEMARRNYIFDTIRSVFKLFGYHQIETPAMENLSTLMGKYGEEGDKLLFKILNSGNYLAGVDPRLLNEESFTRLTPQISDKGLRYDLTVPFARFVVQHRNDLQLPFRRSQIQPVWRADRPQKGRYREFYQCDADVVGSDSLLNEVELLQLIDEVFRRLGIGITIKLNNRKVLAGIAEKIGAPDKMIDITVAIDKIEKIGLEKVNEELADRGLSRHAIAALSPILQITGTPGERLEKLSELLKGSEIGSRGIAELKEVLGLTEDMGIDANIELDVSLARGLNYYTGTIIEVKARDYAIGSITGGGRYDNLTGVFGMPDISGVGISFGADRIYDVMCGLDLFPATLGVSSQVMFVNFGSSEAAASLKTVKQLRSRGVSCELYPDASKLKKQMNYANNAGIPFVAIIGETEAANGTITLKDMSAGTQSTLTVEEVAAAVLK